MERFILDLMKLKGREVERRFISLVINISFDIKNIVFERYEFRFCILMFNFFIVCSDMYILIGNYGWIGIFLIWFYKY